MPEVKPKEKVEPKELESAKTWPEAYRRLAQNFGEDSIQRTQGAKTGKGYDTTGYAYQFIVNRLNEVMGINGWNYTYKELAKENGTSKSGSARIAVTIEIALTLSIGEQSVSKPCVGGHVSNNYTDALKGAITNSLKKTAALFGAGKQAYEKTIDDDHQEPDANKAGEVKKSPTSNDLQTALNFINSCKDTNALMECDDRLKKNKKFKINEKAEIQVAIQKRAHQLLNPAEKTIQI